MAKLCQIRVTPGGRYCCDVKHLCFSDGEVGKVSFANLPATALEYEVTPDVWVPAEPASLEGTGCITLYKSGCYRFMVDCEAIEAMTPPEDPAEQIALCYDDCKVEDWGPILSAQLDELCAKIVAGDDAMAIAEIIAQLEAICEKLLELIANIGDLSELCTKLEAVVTTLESLCEKIEQGNAEQLACLEEIKANQVIQIQQNEILIEKLCQILGDPDAPCPDCPPEDTTKEAVTYINSDNETELTVSVGGNGDIKIGAGGGDGSDAEVAACIEACLAAGDDVVVTWTTIDGGSGSATLLAGATTNSFPNFYNQSTDASGDSGKLLTLTCG